MSEDPKSNIDSTDQKTNSATQDPSTPSWMLALFVISRYLQVYMIAENISVSIGWLTYFLIFVLGGLMMVMNISGLVFPIALIQAIFNHVPWWWWIIVIIGELEMISRVTKSSFND